MTKPIADSGVKPAETTGISDEEQRRARIIAVLHDMVFHRFESSEHPVFEAKILTDLLAGNVSTMRLLQELHGIRSADGYGANGLHGGPPLASNLHPDATPPQSPAPEHKGQHTPPKAHL